MVSDDEPELDAFVHDAHAVFGLDALVAVPDHVLVEHRGELVDRHAPEAPLVEELLLETAEEPLRGRIVRRNSPSRSSTGSARARCRCGSIPATGNGNPCPSG